MLDPAVHEVARATMMARMIYPSPAWWGYLTVEDQEHLERSNQRAICAGFLPFDAPLSVPWLNVQMTPSSVLLSEIVVLSFDTYVKNA